MIKHENLEHDCLEHDKEFPDSLMSCNPKSAICSDCPFSKYELTKRWLKKYPRGVFNNVF